MKPSLPALSRAQLHIVLGLVALLAMVLLVAFALHPLRQREAAIRRQLNEQVAKTVLALQNVRQIKDLDQQAIGLTSVLANETNRFVLRPVLGSFPVQRDIYRLAAETTFKVTGVRDVGKKPTPTEVKSATGVDNKKRPAASSKLKREPKPPPPPAFARYVVEIAGDGSFGDIVTLIASLEAENPYCGVTDLNIKGVPSSPERHRVTMALEWPVLADTPAAAGKNETNR